MAAIARGATVRNVTPTAYEFYDRGTATEDILAGQLVKIGAAGVSLAAGGQVAPSGMAIAPAAAGEVVEFGRQCEIDGFTGMTPGARLYASASVAGNLDDAALAGFVPFIEAISATRVYFRA